MALNTLLTLFKLIQDMNKSIDKIIVNKIINRQTQFLLQIIDIVSFFNRSYIIPKFILEE